MARERYADQVQLLVRLLPIVADERDFALKGGTAINLFYRDLPRLSVDIDLTYVPVKDRAESLADIDAAMDRILNAINKLPNVRGRRIAGSGNGDTRVQAEAGNSVVKVETSPVARGTVLVPAAKRVSPSVEEQFGFAEMQVVAFEDLYGGKFHAALDRQHPRDLYDVKLLYENEGITDDLFRVFLVYVACSGRPPHELLNPNPQALEGVFDREFSGMTVEPVTVKELEDVRTRFFEDIRSRLTGPSALYLRSLQAGAPDFTLIDLPEAANLPAVRWKMQNLAKLIAENPQKHKEQSDALEAIIH
ncbi:nucleotidyl transferase AbiEii/AbiGii toxin family protein [Hyphomonas sp.]|uniref:nucleotidyl transferase AbiEii/AbiGii toxin family protein n=1 Tax=Hyphomonas sp. TaxID=87 RepID=UPI00356B15F8